MKQANRNTQDNRSLGNRQRERLRSVAKAQGLDFGALVARYACERMIGRIGDHTSVDFLVKGGLAFDQRERPTRDADLQFVKSMPPSRVRNLLARCAADLAEEEGIEIRLADSPRVIEAGNGKRIQRWRMDVVIGGTHALTQFDISFGGGFPRNLALSALPSVCKPVAGPADVVAYVQPEAAQAADKIAALIEQRGDDTRLKVLGDVEWLSLRGLHVNDVAWELVRTSVERGIDLEAAECPPMLRMPKFLDIVHERDRSWSALRRTHPHVAPDYLMALCSAWSFYADVRDAALDIIRKPAATAAKYSAGVVDLAAWRANHSI